MIEFDLPEFESTTGSHFWARSSGRKMSSDSVAEHVRSAMENVEQPQVFVPVGSGLSDLNWVTAMPFVQLDVQDSEVPVDALVDARLERLVLVGGTRDLSWLCAAGGLHEVVLSGPKESQRQSIKGDLAVSVLSFDATRLGQAGVSGFSVETLDLSGTSGSISNVRCASLRIWQSRRLVFNNVEAERVEFRHHHSAAIRTLEGLSGLQRLFVVCGQPVRLIDIPAIPELTHVEVAGTLDPGFLGDSGWGKNLDRLLSANGPSHVGALAAKRIQAPSIVSYNDGEDLFVDGATAAPEGESIRRYLEIVDRLVAN